MNLDSFMLRVQPEPNTGCWLWAGGWEKDGYGMTSGNTRVHRLSYELHRGAIAPGLVVCHKCDVRCCVNPDHLFLGTNEQNTMDRHIKGRTAHGEKNGWAILREHQVLEIINDRRTCTAIAKSYGLTPSNISHIRTGRTWKHVPRNNDG